MLVEDVIKKYNIKNYTYSELHNAFKNMGFAIIDLYGEIAEKYFEILGISSDESNTAFLCNYKGVKVVFIDSYENYDVKCFQLACLLYLAEEKDSRLAENNKKYKACEFAVHLKDLLQTPEEKRKPFAIIQKIGIIIIICVTAVAGGILGTKFTAFDSEKSASSEYQSSFTMFSADVDISTVEASKIDSFAHSVDDIVSVDNESVISNEKDDDNLDVDTSNTDNNHEQYVIAEPVISDSDAQSYTESEIVYYVTKSGKKYHVAGCQYIKELSACTQITADSVLKSSYSPCTRCIK